MSDADWSARMLKTLDYAVKWKAAILKRGLHRAKAKCPYCEHGFWHGVIMGFKKHLHFRCDSCSTEFHE